MRRFIPTFVIAAGITAALAGSAQAAQPTQLCAPSKPGAPVVCRIDPAKTVLHVKGKTTACTDTNGQKPYVCDAGSAEHPIWGRTAQLNVFVDCINFNKTIKVVGRKGSGTYDHSFKALQPAINAELAAGDSCSVIITPVTNLAARSNELPWLYYGPGYTKK